MVLGGGRRPRSDEARERLISCSRKAEWQKKKVRQGKKDTYKMNENVEFNGKKLTKSFLQFVASPDLPNKLPLKGVHIGIQLKRQGRWKRKRVCSCSSDHNKREGKFCCAVTQKNQQFSFSSKLGIKKSELDLRSRVCNMRHHMVKQGCICPLSS